MTYKGNDQMKLKKLASLYKIHIFKLTKKTLHY